MQLASHEGSAPPQISCPFVSTENVVEAVVEPTVTFPANEDVAVEEAPLKLFAVSCHVEVLTVSNALDAKLPEVVEAI